MASVNALRVVCAVSSEYMCAYKCVARAYGRIEAQKKVEGKFVLALTVIVRPATLYLSRHSFYSDAGIHFIFRAVAGLHLDMRRSDAGEM